MNWRLASRLSVITLAILVVILVTVFQQRAQSQGAAPTATPQSGQNALDSQGTRLDSTPAPDFHLTDQNGLNVSLSQFKGQPRIVTFLYTHCPDQCPLIAEKLHTTMVNLGDQARQVGILVVSVDPKGDDQAAAQKFSQQHRMQDYWHFLTGTREKLSPVWSAYHLYNQPDQPVGHGLGIFIIDKQGNEQLFLKDDFDPQQLTAALQQLLKE